MLNIGVTVEHDLPNGWKGTEIVEPDARFAPAFKAGMVIIHKDGVGVRGLSHTLEFAVKVTKNYGHNPKMHFPFTPHDELELFSIQLEMSEAIQLARLSHNTLWTRPVGRIGSGAAMLVEDDDILHVPGSTGARPAHMVSVSEIMGLWQVTSPRIVLSEFDENMLALQSA
jgi:hypothetical protein